MSEKTPEKGLGRRIIPEISKDGEMPPNLKEHGPLRMSEIGDTKNADDTLELTEHMKEQTPSAEVKGKKKTITRARSLQDLGAAMEAHAAATTAGSKERPVDMQSDKRFEPKTVDVSSRVERLPDETLPEYRARLKSALKTSVAGIQITGIDPSKFSVRVPRTSEKVKSRKEMMLDDKLERRFTDETDKRERNDFSELYDREVDAQFPRKDRKRPSARGEGADVSSKDKTATENAPSRYELVPTGKAQKPNTDSTLEYLGPIPSGGKRNLKSETEAGRVARGITEAEKAYFDAIKAFQKSRMGVGIAAENLTGELSTKELKELRREWVRSRAAYARAQLDSVDERLAGRSASPEQILDGLKNYKGKGHFTPEEIKARYERMVTIRSTVLGAEEAEKQMRVEGLSERDRGSFEKALSWYKSKPLWMRIGATSALMFGGAAVFGSGIGFAMLGLGGGKIAAGALAEMKKGTLLGTRFGLAGRVLGIGAIAGLANEALLRGIHSIAGTEEKAEKLLAKKEKLGDLSDEKTFEKISQSRKNALGAHERVARHGRLARIAGSLTGGFLFGHAFHGNAPASGSGAHELNHSGSGASDEALRRAAGGPGGIHTESLSIHGKVFDADRLFGHFRDQLAKEYPDISKAPASVRALVEHHGSQDDLTKWLGFQNKDGVSTMMHEGDTVSVQPNGELVFTTAAGQSYTVIDAQGNMHAFDLTKFHTTGAPHLQEAHTATATESTGVNTAPAGPSPENAAPADVANDSLTQSDTSGAADNTTASPGAALPANDNIEYPPESAYIYKPEGSDPFVGTTPGLMPAEGEPGSIPAPDAAGVTTLHDIVSGPASASPTEVSAPGVESATPGDGDISNLGALANSSPASADILTNIHNVPLALGSPHEYVWKLPETDTERLFAFGGTSDASSELAHDYVASHPPGSVMFFVTEKRNLLGIVESKVSAWLMNEKGRPELIPDALDQTGKALPVPNTDDFTRLIK